MAKKPRKQTKGKKVQQKLKPTAPAPVQKPSNNKKTNNGPNKQLNTPRKGNNTSVTPADSNSTLDRSTMDIIEEGTKSEAECSEESASTKKADRKEFHFDDSDGENSWENKSLHHKLKFTTQAI